MPTRRELPDRDQDLTAFSKILQNLLDAVPGAAGAALVDNLGECVDYAGVLDPFDIRIASAHVQLEMRKAAEALASGVGHVHGLIVRAGRRSYFAREIVDGYVVVVVFTGGSPFSVSPRAVSQSEYDLRVEGGWEPPPEVERWVLARVEARPHDRWRPARVELAEVWHNVEVIGAVVGLGEAERGFRVRTDSGLELTLIRERTGVWYTDVFVR